MGNNKLKPELNNSVKEKLNGSEIQDGDILDRALHHVGDLGLYQKLMFLAMLPLGFTYAFVFLVQLFIAVTPQNHWCRVPELANLSMELRRNLSAPGAITGTWDHCRTFDTNWTKVLETLTPPALDTATVPCQHGWEFEFSDIPYETVPSEREWVCDQATNVPTAASMFFVGSVLGGFLFGWMADRFGRVTALIGANLIGGIGGVATIFTKGVWDFIVCRFLVGMSFDSCFMMLYILVLEYVGPQYRTLAANLILALSYAVAGVSLPWLAYFISDWRLLLWVTATPMFLVLFAPWVYPESIRWLMSKGRMQESLAILKKFENTNGNKIPEHVIDEFIIAANKKGAEETQNLLSLFNSPPLLKAMLSLMIIYMGCAIVFDGLARMSDSLGIDFFVVFSVLELSELISILIVAVILDRFGRRKVCVGPMFAAGVFLFVALFLPKGISQVVFQISSRFFVNTCYTTVMQWTTEILPTPFRARGCSFLHTCAFAATAIAPFIVYSERYWNMLPRLIFSVTALLTASVGMTLPETKGLPLPQTVAEGEANIRATIVCGKPEEYELAEQVQGSQ